MQKWCSRPNPIPEIKISPCMVEFECLCCCQMKQLQHVSVNETENNGGEGGTKCTIQSG